MTTWTPTAQDIAERVSSMHGFNPVRSGSRWRTVAVCHHGDAPDSLSIRDRPNKPGWYDVRCFSGSCERNRIMDALESATGWKLRTSLHSPPDRPGRSNSSRSETQDAIAPERTDSGAPRVDTRALARTLWARSERIGPSASTTARRWLASRNLWNPKIPLPSGVRWASRDTLHEPAADVAGAIVCAYALPAEWERAFPKTPAPDAVEYRPLNAEGTSVRDRPPEQHGVQKRTLGIKTGGRVCLLGDPRAEIAPGLALFEGLTDALAWTAREPDSAAAVGGTGGLDGAALSTWLDGWTRTQMFADRDSGGLDGALNLRAEMMTRNVPLRFVRASPPYNDYAEWAAAQPPLKLTEDQLEAARDLARDYETEGLPPNEAARRAAQIVSDQ